MGNRGVTTGARGILVVTTTALVVGAMTVLALLLGIRDAERASGAWDTDCAAPTLILPVGGVFPTNLNLTSADTVLIQSGTFTGNLSSSGGTICVAAGAAF